MKNIIIAIDGFSSCGKSTMAKELAQSISYTYVDSGAMYRAVTLFCMQQNLIQNDNVDATRLSELIDQIEIGFKFNAETGKSETYLNGNNVEQAIRTMDVSNHVSLVSTLPLVRKFVDKNLHQLGKQKGIVMDGRDIGSSVFPDAELKIFVTAKPSIRAQRRLDELHAKGEKAITFDEVLKNLENRDFTDQNRAESPLTQAKDAVVLDNSELNREQQMEWLLELFNNTIANL